VSDCFAAYSRYWLILGQGGMLRLMCVHNWNMTHQTLTHQKRGHRTSSWRKGLGIVKSIQGKSFTHHTHTHQMQFLFL